MRITLTNQDVEYVKNAVEMDLKSIEKGEPACDKCVYEYHREELEVAARHLASIDNTKRIVITIDKAGRPVWQVG